MLSGLFDLAEAYRHYPPSVFSQLATGKTEAAHIIPFSMGSFEEQQVSFFWVNVISVFDYLPAPPCGKNMGFLVQMLSPPPLGGDSVPGADQRRNECDDITIGPP